MIVTSMAPLPSNLFSHFHLAFPIIALCFQIFFESYSYLISLFLKQYFFQDFNKVEEIKGDLPYFIWGKVVLCTIPFYRCSGMISVDHGYQTHGYQTRGVTWLLRHFSPSWSWGGCGLQAVHLACGPQFDQGHLLALVAAVPLFLIAVSRK